MSLSMRDTELQRRWIWSGLQFSSESMITHSACICHCLLHRWEGYEQVSSEHQGLGSLMEATRTTVKTNRKIKPLKFLVILLTCYMFLICQIKNKRPTKTWEYVWEGFCVFFVIFKCDFPEIAYCQLHPVQLSLMNNSAKHLQVRTSSSTHSYSAASEATKMLKNNTPYMVIYKHQTQALYMCHFTYAVETQRGWATPCRSPISRHACCVLPYLEYTWASL